MTALSAYVITLNEEHLIGRCLDSLLALTPNVLVLDSGSTDNTQQIALDRGAVVETRPFDDYAKQRNHALDRIESLFGPSMVITLDADEYFRPSDLGSLATALNDPTFDVGLLPRRVIFMDRELKWGSRRHIVLPRIFRSHLRYEDREVNEHIAIPANAKVEELPHVIVHDDGATWTGLVNKHAAYAEREGRIRAARPVARLTAPPKERHLRNRWLREQVYERTPGKVPLSFVVQYVARGGFLDGRAGLDRAVLDAFTEYSIDHHARRRSPSPSAAPGVLSGER